MIDAKILEKIKPGATVKVWEKISSQIAVSAGKSRKESKEKGSDKERLSQFEGLILARKHGSEPGATFTVRATIAGVGVEKIFPIHSPKISKIDVLSSPRKVRRAKLYYLRTRSRKEVRQQTEIVSSAEGIKKTVAKEEEKAPEKTAA